MNSFISYNSFFFWGFFRLFYVKDYMTYKIKIILLSFQSFLSLNFYIIHSCLIAPLEPPVKCWIEVVRMEIFVLFLILGGKHPIIHHWVWYQLWVFIDAFYQIEKFPSIPSLLNVFIMQWCLILSNAFSTSIEMIIWFLIFLFYWYGVLYYLIFRC